MWETESQMIPEYASSKDKYEIAFKNFMQKWVTANNFVAENQGEAGIKKFMHEAIQAWKRKYSRSALVFRIVNSISSKIAFSRLAERLAFQLQAFSPFIVSELDGYHMILTVAPCNILQSRGKSDFLHNGMSEYNSVLVKKPVQYKNEVRKAGNELCRYFYAF